MKFDDGSPVTFLGLLGRLWGWLQSLLSVFLPDRPTFKTAGYSAVLTALLLAVLGTGFKGCTLPPWPWPTPSPTPVPVDPLVAALQAAYNSDPDPAKASNVQGLAVALSGVVANAKAAGGLQTDKDLQDYVHGYCDKVVGPHETIVPNVRKAVGDYLVTTLHKDPTAPIPWDLAASEYAKVSNALKGVK